MVNVFSTVVPLLVICSVLVSALTLRRCGWQLTIAAVPSVSPLLSHWAIAACSFVSYNLFSSIGILAPVGKELRSRRTVWWGVLLGCIILISIALGIFLTMETLPTVVEAPLPMLAAAGALGGGWYYLWGAAALCHARYRAFLRRCSPPLLHGSLFHHGEPPLQLCPSVGYPRMAVQPFRLREAHRHCLPYLRSTGCTGPAGVAAPSLHPSRAKVAATAFSWAKFMPFTGYGRRPAATGFARVFRPKGRNGLRPHLPSAPRPSISRHPPIR